MRTCDECGAEASAGATECPSCGGALAPLQAAGTDSSAEIITADDDAEAPAGTWASIPSDPPARAREATPVVKLARRPAKRSEATRGGAARKLEPTAPAEVLQLPVAARLDAARRDATESGVRTQSGARPPRWLATEILRERPDPEPLAMAGRVVSGAAGLCGVGAALVFAALGAEHGYVAAAIFSLLAGGALVPIPFLVRAGGLAVISSIGLGLAVATRGGEGSDIELAILGATLLAGAQILRSLRRDSRFASYAMMVGLVVAVTWLVLSGGLQAFVVHGPGLDAWLAPAVRLALVGALVLSLFAWLDPTGASGTDVWPWLVLAWIGLDSAALLLGATPSGGGPVDPTHGLAVVATPLLALVAAVAWAQVWATTPGLGSPSRDTARD